MDKSNAYLNIIEWKDVYNGNIDLSKGKYFKKEVYSDTNFFFTNITDRYIVLSLENKGTFNVNLPSIYWENGTKPVLQPYTTDIYTFISFNGKIYGKREMSL